MKKSILHTPSQITQPMSLMRTNLRAFLVLTLLFAFSNANAQPGIGISYTVSQPLLPLPLVSAATTSILAAQDDAVSVVTKPAGFSFTYGGRTYDGFVASSNGWLSLIPAGVGTGGAAATTLGFNATGAPTNNLANHPIVTGASYPVIAPLWDNLKSNVLFGYSAPNLVVRWTSVSWDPTSTNTSTSFAAILNTSTGSIRFVYTTILAPTNPSASIGITGPCAGDYYSWKESADFPLSPSVAGTAGTNTITFPNVAGLTTGMLVIPPSINPTLTVAATATTALTVSTSTNLQVGMFLNGPGVPAGTTLSAINVVGPPAQITVSNPVTIPVNTPLSFSYLPQGTVISGISGTTVTFSNTFPVSTPTTASFRFVTTALDSVTEFNTIGTTPRPQATYLEWTPNKPWNDDCAASYPTVGGATPNLGNITSATCSPLTWATTHATTSSNGALCSGATNDVWFTVTKPAGVGNFIIRTAASSCSPNGSVAGTEVEVFSGACGALGSLGCSTTGISGSGTFGEVAISASPCSSATYTIRVAGDANESGKFTICAIVDASVGSTCASAIPVPSIPATFNCVGTAGSGNDYNNNGCNAGYNGEDLVYSFTPSADQCINIATTGGTGTGGAIFVFAGCPGTGTCVGSATSGSANITLSNLSVAAGTTYYIVIDNLSLSSGLSNMTVSFSASSIGTPTNDNNSGAIPVPLNGACVNASTFCASPTPTSVCNAAVPACGSYNNDPDVWFSFTVVTAGSGVTLTTSAGATLPMADPAMAVYTGGGVCGGAAGSIIACNDNLTGNFPGVTMTGLLPGTYYVRVWAKSGTALGNFSICATSCSPPPNDNCSGAASLGTVTAGVCNAISSTTTCTGGSTVPVAPPCGNYAGNDVWFTVNVTSTASPLIINIQPGSGTAMTDPAMALYSGSTCGTLTLVSCTPNSSNAFTVSTTGTYYIRVWPESGTPTGSFTICATTNCNVQDECASAIPLTASVATIYGTYSNTCATTSCGIPEPTCANFSTGFGSVQVLSGGAGYGASATYTGVQISGGGAGTGGLVNVTTNASGQVTSVTINAGGFGYTFSPNCFSGSLVAGSGTPALPTPTTPATLSFGKTAGHNDIWFTVQVPASGGLTLTGLVGSMTDPVMEVYTGNCGALVPLRCDDDGGPGLAPEMTWCTGNSILTPGQTLYVRVWPYSRYTPDGTFQLAAVDPAAVGAANPYQADNPCNITTNFPVNGLGSCNMTYMSFRCSTPSTNFATVYTTSAASAGGANTLTFTSTVGMSVGQNIANYSYFNFPQGTFITAISGNTVTISNPLPATLTVASGTNFSVSSLPDPYNCWPFANGTYGSTGYSPSNDIWVRVVVPPGVTGMNFNTMYGTEFDDNMAVYRATSCSTMTQLGCDDLNGPGVMPYLSLAGLVPGETLYVRHYPWFGGTTRQGDFTFCVEAACTTSAVNDEVCQFIPLTPTAGCLYQGPFTNSCASPTQPITGPVNPTCGSFFSSGGTPSRDVWFSTIVPASGQIAIDMQSISIPDAAMAVYTAPACSSTTGWVQVGCDDNSSTNSLMPYLNIQNLTPGARIFIRVWAKSGLSGDFNLCVVDPCPLGIPANDDPCNAVLMTPGITYSGYNSCATSCTDPGANCTSVPPVLGTYPPCWSTGAGETRNTVWYKFVAPSTSVVITTTLGTLTNTQIALYTGTFCFALPTTPFGGFCNNDYLQCGVNTLASQIIATGLTVGTTYYIMLDGVGNLTGTFSISMFDANQVLPATPQQDCPLATVICSDSTVFSSPGFVGAGNICDLGAGGTAYGCIPATGARENNSAFFAFNIGTTGQLLFDIIPTQSGANYDWALWDITGQTMPGGAPNGTVCANILNNTQAMIACNWSTLTTFTSGWTGMGSTSPCTSCSTTDTAYSTSIVATAGQTYLLMINNTSGTAAGFTLDFGNSNVVAYATASTLNWSGGANTIWNNTPNWGGCGSPSCGVGANILPGLNQPVIPTGAIDTVFNLTINPGASLTLQPGSELCVCGNFINNGSLVASPTSTVRFIGQGNTQTISGNLTGTSRFGHVIIDKPGGQVNLNTTVEVGGNFSTANGTSILNLNNKTLRLFGNFTNFNGSTTIIGAGTGATGSTVEFLGTTQTYTNNGSDLILNNVTINQSSAANSVTLTGTNGHLICGPSGILTLTKGRFITNANEVEVRNTASGGATAGSTQSYVDGWMRRFFANSGVTPFTYNFAVGEYTVGYQLAELKFTTMPSAPYSIAMRFLRWGGSNLPLVNGPYPPLECANYDWSLKPALNHGYWTTTSSITNPTGVYDLTLYNNLLYSGVNTTSSYPSSGQAAAGNVIPFNTSTLAGLSVGMNVLGVEIPAGATITAWTATSVTLSVPTLAPIVAGSYINFFTSGGAGRFDALTIMKDTSGTNGGAWKMEAICPCNNAYPPAARPASKRYQYNATASGFTNYATVQFSTALPVELTTFTAEQTDYGNLCKWTTASETNNDYFEVERSYDGENFTSIGMVPGFGAGTTSVSHSYSFVDKDPCNGIVYYRLRQVDIDMNSTHSDIVVLNCMRSKEELVLFPNPANDKITYTFFENSEGVVDVEIIDMLGRTVQFERYSVSSGFNSLHSLVGDLPAGIYHVKVQRLDRTGDSRLIRFTKR